MSDLTNQDIENFGDNLSKLTKMFGRNADALGKAADAEKRLRMDLGKASDKAKGASSALKDLTTSASDAGAYFRSILGGGLIGGTLAALVDIGMSMADTYRELSAVGHTFNGSMLEMSIAAADAGMPLDEFATAVKANSLAFKSLRKEQLPGLQRQLHTAMAEASNFGMTMGGVTDFTSKYWETTRRTGLLQHMSNNQLVEDTVELASVTESMSKATGVAREAMVDLANSAIQNSLSASRIAAMGVGEGIAANKRLQQSITVLASQAGAAGEFLSSLAANSFGMDGMAEFTEEGRALITVGLGHLANSFNDLSPEGTVDAMNNFRSEIERNLPNLRDLAKSSGAGAAEAQKLLQVYGEMKHVSRDELKRKAEEKDGMTKFMLTINTLWNQIAGNFRTGFLKGFMPLFDSVADFQKSAAFKSLGRTFEKLGTAMGNVVSGLLSEKNVENFQDKFGRLIVAFEDYDLAAALSAVWDFFADIDWAGVGNALKATLSVFVEVGKLLGPIATALGPILPMLIVGRMLFGGLFGVAGKLLGGLFGLGKGVGKVGGLFTGLGGVLGNLITGLGGLFAGGLGKTLLKGGARLLGGVGGGMMVYDGASSVNTEDKTDKALGYGESALGGAMLGATIGSFIPVIGTAVGAAVGGAGGLIAAGISDWMSDDSPSKNQISESETALEKQETERRKRAGTAEKRDLSEKIDKMIGQQRTTNDLLVGAARSQAGFAEEHERLLRQIARKDA